jgi:hypothetical protein
MLENNPFVVLSLSKINFQENKVLQQKRFLSIL